jgi:hypothetical protein
MNCVICFEELNDSIEDLPCKHQFHKKCLAEWIYKNGKSCPLCRNKIEIQKSDYVPNNYIHKMSNNFSSNNIKKWNIKKCNLFDNIHVIEWKYNKFYSEAICSCGCKQYFLNI